MESCYCANEQWELIVVAFYVLLSLFQDYKELSMVMW